MIAMNSILIAAAALGGLGIAFAVVLIVSNRYLAVKANPQAELLLSLLPGVNCGACGFPGCQGFADALLDKMAEASGCVAGGADVAGKLAQALGVSVEIRDEMTAFVACRAGRKISRVKYVYEGVSNCQAANVLFGGDKYCEYGCLGLGSCVSTCPFGAISINEEQLAIVNPEKCRACEKCVAACPRKLIVMVPKKQTILVACHNVDRAKKAKEACSIACTACKICEKNCPEQAVRIENNIAVIDYSKCTQCGICVERCPQKTFLCLNK